MSTWVLNFVLQCLKMVKDDQNMLHALLDLISLLCWTIRYKLIARLMIFERIFEPSKDEVIEMDEIT